MKTLTVFIVFRTLLVTGFLLCALSSNAQSGHSPALKISSLGINAFSLTVTNGMSNGNYEILWTPALYDTVDYPWMPMASGNPGQTNFILNIGDFPAGFFASAISTNMIPLWASETNAGMLAWWRANQLGLHNGDAVTNWTDYYGNVLHGSAIFNSSGMNGYSSVDFHSAANNALSNSVILPNHLSLTNCGTIFVMFAWPHPPTPPGGEALLNCSVSNNATYFNLAPDFQDTYGMSYLYDSWVINNSLSGGGNISFDSNTNDDEHLFIMTWTNGVWQDYLDGKLADDYPAGGHVLNTIFPVSLMGMLTIGNTFDGAWPLQGSISEIGIATNYWNFQSVDQAANYLLKQCGMIRPTIVLYGDSMMWGGDGGYLGGVIDYLSTNFPGWTIDNCSVSGTGSQQMLYNFRHMANYSTATTKKIAVFWDNLNNDGIGIASLNISSNNLYQCADIALTNGQVPVLVIPPSNPRTDTNGQRFAFEDMMTNNPGNFQFICNLSLNPNVGYSNAWTNEIYYYPEGGEHLDSAGNATISAQFISTIEQIISGF